MDADAKIYYLDEIFNVCLIQENSLVKMLDILLREREKKRTDPEMKHTEFSYRFRNIYLNVFTVSLNIKILKSSTYQTLPVLWPH